MPPPILLHYYITQRCNCRCRFCDIWKIPARKSDDADLGRVIRNLHDARALGVRFVDFTGGEPLLHDQLPEMLSAAKRLHLQTTITTNTLLYPKKAALLRGRVDFLHFSIDALHAEKHDAIRGRRAFEHVMRSIDAARDLGETPDLLFTVDENNIDELAPLTRFAQALQMVLVVNPVFSYSGIAAPQAGLLRKIERLKTRPFVYVNTAFHQLRRRGGNQINSPRCRVIDSTIVISPDNNVLLPCYHFQQQKINIDRPNLKDMTEDGQNRLQRIRRSAVFKYYQKRQGRFDFCQGCHLNCYFDPSFQYQLDDYFWLSILAKSRYWFDKNIRRRLQGGTVDRRPARDIAESIIKNHDASR